MAGNPAPYFSIVMSIFNQEEWLERAVESLLAQDLDFETHVELILVNDGSSDSSLEICRSYHDRFPKNVRVIDQANAGLSAARNTGIQVATGRFVNFMDPDDLLEPKALASVKRFADAHEKEELPVLSIPLYFAGRKSGLHPKYLSLPEESAVVDLTATPDAFILTSAASFYPREVIRQYRYDPQNIAAEDSEVNLKIQRDHGFRLGYVREEDAGYLYWQHQISNSMIGQNQQRREPAESIIRFLENLIANTEQIHPAIRSAMVYLLRPRLIEVREEWFSSRNDEQHFWDRLHGLLKHISAEEIASSPWVTNRPTHFLFATAASASAAPWTLSPRDGSILDRDTPVFPLASFPVRVHRINRGPSSVEVEAAFYSYRVAGFDLVLVDETGQVVESIESVDADSALSPKTKRGPVSQTCYRRFVVQLPDVDRKLRFAYRSTQYGSLHFASDVQNVGRSPFTGNDESMKASGDGYWIRFTSAQEIWIRRASSSNWLYNLRSTIRLAIRQRKIIPARLFAASRKKVILINDRPMFGDDNGEALFRYVQEQRKDLARNTWLVLDKNAPAYAELKPTGRVVAPRSFKHKRLFLNTRILLSSHLAQVFNSPWEGRERRACADVVDQTFVWLQHGVTKDAIDRAFNRLAFDVDGLVVATKHESTYALRSGSFHSTDSVIEAGFPRFDLLKDTSAAMPSRTLLVTPTWRTWLTGRLLSDGTHAAKEGFEESAYFIQHKSLLTSPQLLHALKTAGAHIEFLLHPGMSVYADLYQQFASEQVLIHLPGSVRYQDVLTRSVAMITDYSSVFFDFSYMNKPVLFDHSDIADYRASHYQEGVFDYERQAPGPVLHNFESLLTATVSLIEADFRLDPEYEDRLKALFLHHDHSNSERVIEAALAVDALRREGGRRGAKR